MIKLRFVHGTELDSELIEYREQTCMPFVPSHVEAVSLDGQFWIGQHIVDGMLARPAGYDSAKPENELFLDLPSTPEQEKAFYDFVNSKIGEPYDWRAILGFAFVPGHQHVADSAICSAVMTLALRSADWFPSRAPLCVPAHLVDPRDLLLILSAIVEVPH